MQYSYSLLLPQAHIALLCPPRLRLPLYVVFVRLYFVKEKWTNERLCYWEVNNVEAVSHCVSSFLGLHARILNEEQVRWET